VFGYETGEKGGARGIAHGKLAVGVLENNATLGKAIDVGGLNHGIAIAAKAGVEIVNDEQENVRTRGGWSCRERRRGRGEE
jgi:hypothetical protein